MKETPVPTVLLGDVLWRRLDEPAFDHCQLQRIPGAHALNGVVLAMADGQPQRVYYNVLCGPDWVTREVHIHAVRGPAIRRLHLRRDDTGRWWRDDERVPEFDGLGDIDLAITPATNTLPIRRLALDAGASGATDALWVRPDLALEHLPQRYTRLAANRYLYESRGGAFTAELEVDEQGLVIRYGHLWERVAP